MESETATNNNEVSENVTKREGKIFVGGLTWDTSIEDVKTYFGQFGNVIDASIIKDPSTGRSRGFGFVVFDDEATVKKVFDIGSHIINGKKVDTKNAFRRNSEPTCRKIFVGGVDPMMAEPEIREYFSKFGQIEEIDFPWDKEKNQRRAFCFVAFVSPEVVDEILKQPRHKLGDRMVDVKKATPKQDTHANAGNNNLAWNLISQALNLNNSGALLASLLANPNPLVGGGGGLGGLGGGINLPGAGLGGGPNLSALQAALSAAQNPAGRIPSSAAALAAAAAAAMASQNNNGPSGMDDGRMPGGLGQGNNPVVDALTGLNYGPGGGSGGNMLSSQLSSLLGGNQGGAQNPYLALAAAAAGIVPPSNVDLTSWYSNLAAAAANQDGHGGHHPSSHRDMPPSYHHGHGSSHMSGGSSGYGKASRSSAVLSPNPGHRNAPTFHPYSR